MINRKNIGSALVDYVIPTAVVGVIVGTGLYYLASEGKILKFTAASGDMSLKLSEHMAVVGYKESTSSVWDEIVAGSLGGTSDKPVSSCSVGNCTIDYGDFVLTGIPEDLSEFVEFNGVSGGTEKLAAIVDQLAEEMRKNDKPDQADELSRYGKLLKLNGSPFEFFENMVKNGATDQEFHDTFFNSTKLSDIGYKVPSDLISALPKFDNDQLTAGFFSFSSSPGFAQKFNPQDYNVGDKVETQTGYAIADLYNSIISDPSYPDSIKNVLTDVQIGANDLVTHGSAIYNATAQVTKGSDVTYSKYDAVTGETKPSIELECGYVNDIINPKVTFDENIFSSI